MLIKDDSVFPLAVRRVLTQRRKWSAAVAVSYMVGEHPWAGAGFRTRTAAEKFLNNFISSMEPRNETPKPRGE